MHTIATLDRLSQYLGIPAGVDDARLRTVLEAASRHMERCTQRTFTPRHTTLYHTVDRSDPTCLFLDDDLLALGSITTNDGASIPLGDVLLLPPLEDTPASVLALKNGQVFTWADTPIQAVAVTGIWGWHDDWANAWRSSGDQSLTSLSAASTLIPVINAAGTDSAGGQPRLQVGQIIRLDDEYLRITAIALNPEGADELTVRRGINGTQAAAHALNAPIDVFQPAQDVEMLVLRWAAWLYKAPERLGRDDIPSALITPVTLLRRMTL